MAGECSMTIKPSVSIPRKNLLHRSSNRTNFKKSRLLYFPVSGLNHNASSRQSITSISFQCRCTNKENLGESKALGGDLELWKQFVSELQMKKETLSAVLKWVALGFVSLLHLKSYKKEPKNISFNELFGVDDIILEFQDIISILHGKSESKKPMAKLPNGILLYGPPRTGKTTLVHAMAREARVPFFRVSAYDIASGDVNIKSLFIEARRCSPSIVFVDHIHFIASVEGNCESYPTLIQLHTEMDKCYKDGEMVVVIAATDSPETLDPAFMSSSRFYKTCHVTKPDQDCRHKKAAFCFKDHIKEEDKEAICNLVASQTSGLGWANLEDIIVESRLAAEYRGGDHVTIDDVREAIRGVDEYIRVMKMLELRNNPCDS